MKKIFLVAAIVSIMLNPILAEARDSNGEWLCGTPLLWEQGAEDFAEVQQLRAIQGTPMKSPLPPVDVGDQREFWTWDLNVMPPGWQRTPATCRAVGENSYLWIADDQWNVNVTQDDVDIIFSYFEESTPESSINPDWGIYDINTTVFGEPPDEHDMDPHIYILYFNIGAYHGSTFDGYWNVYDEMTEEEAQQYGQHSNEVEIFYMDCDPTDPSSPGTLGVLAHEFQHMIHWNHDKDEVTWINEGCSELAMFVTGLFYDNAHVASFANFPDDPLTKWDQQIRDYGQVALWALYMYEQYGGVDFFYQLVHETKNDLNGIESTLGDLGYTETFNPIFKNWVMANFIDDPELFNGLYGYQGYDLPAFKISQTYSSYPVSHIAGTVNKWAADYMKFTGGSMQLNLYYLGPDNLETAAGVIKSGGPYVTEPHYLPLSDTFAGQCQVPEFGTTYDEVILVATFPDDGAEIAEYEYIATDQAENDVSAPAVLDYRPLKVDVRGSETIDILLIDDLSDLDLESFTATINGTPIELEMEPVDKGYRLSYAEYWAEESTYLVVLDAEDAEGNGLKNFTWGFRTGSGFPTVTPTPEPTPTPGCPETGITCEMPDPPYKPGDVVYLKTTVCNADPDEDLQVPIFVFLDIGVDQYWFAPSWTIYPPNIDYYDDIVIPACSCITFDPIPEFTWPSNAGNGGPFTFWCGMTDSTITSILDLVECEFYFQE